MRPRVQRSAVNAVASLVALAVSYRHAVARHTGGATDDLDQELQFLAEALTATDSS